MPKKKIRDARWLAIGYLICFLSIGFLVLGTAKHYTWAALISLGLCIYGVLRFFSTPRK